MRIRQASYLPIIVLGSQEKAAETLELGADAYMTKPPSPSELVARVRSLLRRKPRYDPPGDNSEPEIKSCLTKEGNRPMPGVVLKHFTARDIISRWDVLEAHTRATSHTASGFIDTLLERMPFPIKAIQVDGGSEFQDAFERECQRRGIKLFVLPPRSSKLNGHVERAQKIHTEEFYEVAHANFEVSDLN